MRVKQAVKHFGKKAEVARVLGIDRALVTRWGEIVPLKYAWELERKSGGKLRLRLNDYRPKVVE